MAPIYYGIDKDLGQRIYFPFASGQYRMSLGLQALSLDEWIEIDETFTRYLHLKREQLQRDREESVIGLAGTEVAQQELLDMLLEYLLLHFPEHYQQRGMTIVNLKTGEIWNPQAFAAFPIDLAGRLIQEDLCLMIPTGDDYILKAASVCFPLHWRLKDKIGQSVARIHAPVPGYESKLKQPVKKYFDRLRPNAPGYRFNWTVIGTPDLTLRPEKVGQLANNITSDHIGDRFWIRVERQTLRRLPKTNGILFNIRTYIYPLSLLEKYPQAALGLSQAIFQVPSPMKIYKNLTVSSETLQVYLDRIINSTSTALRSPSDGEP